MARTQQLQLIETQSDQYEWSDGEFWFHKSRQQMHSLHYALMGGAIGPEFADYGIRNFSQKGDVVFDPYCDHGAIALQANLLGRVVYACDVNPLSVLITKAKTTPARLDEVALAIPSIPFTRPIAINDRYKQFAPFYHPDTYRELVNLRHYLLGNPGSLNRFITLVAISRLHGHSKQFFSAYTSPHECLSEKRQTMLNKKRGELAEYRPLAPRLLQRSSAILRDGVSSEFRNLASKNQIWLNKERRSLCLGADSTDLVIASIPSHKHKYSTVKEWLRIWFCGISVGTWAENPYGIARHALWKERVLDMLTASLHALRPGRFVVLGLRDVNATSTGLSLDKVIASSAERIAHAQKRFVLEKIIIQCSSDLGVTQKKKYTHSGLERIVVLKVVSKRRKVRD